MSLLLAAKTHVRLRKSQTSAQTLHNGGLRASNREVLKEIAHIVSQEQAEMANISQYGSTEAFEPRRVANIAHPGHHRAGEALHNAGLTHRRDVLYNSEAPEEPVWRQFCDTFPTFGARNRR